MPRWGDLAYDDRVHGILEATSDLRAALSDHPVYTCVTDLGSAKTFMDCHVYAVWDFMSLLKQLQRRLTGIEIPWTPKGDPAVRRFVNELVLEEESDEHPVDGFISHFELYLEAMEQAACDTSPIRRLVASVTNASEVPATLEALGLPHFISQFVNRNFAMIGNGRDHEVAATFAFGREELIPRMFEQLGRAVDAEPQRLDLFGKYLVRHITLDGEVHTPMAFRMLTVLCGSDETSWAEATKAATIALEARIALWDGTYHLLRSAD